MKGGILIIGSLFWDNNQGEKINFRKTWRNKRLNIKDKIHVKAPIRYGRTGLNKETYTMVFSSEIDKDEKFGTAYVVPFKNIEIKSFKGILNQARFLSEAERSNNKKLCKGNVDKWCTIGILFNPNFDSVKKNKILKKWEKSIRKDDGLIDHLDYCIEPEQSILSNKGEILINWLNPVDINKKKELNSFDFIIATCTKQDLKKYPKSELLKETFLNDKRKYFYKNIENGITTFQDREILKQI